MVDALEKQANWESKNAQHLRHRMDVARQTLRMKIAMAAITSMLDFDHQMISAQRQYLEGAHDAYKRLVAVDLGLRQLYQYPYPEADALPALSQDPGSFDEVVSWARRAGRWLAAFNRRCNNYVLPVSVRRLTGSGWDSGRSKGQWTFQVPTTLFDARERHVRLRGITAWALNDRDQLWETVVIPPKSTRVYYESDALSDPFVQECGTCRIAKVVSRRRVVMPEVSGITALYNASPLGEWTVTIRHAFDRETVPKQIPDDVELDLYLSVLTV